eukprot:jgi/Mesvir1/6312/Mv08146-RA.1
MLSAIVGVALTNDSAATSTHGAASTSAVRVRVTDFPPKVPKAAAREEEVDVFVVELVMACGNGGGGGAAAEDNPLSAKDKPRSNEEKPELASATYSSAPASTRARASKRRKADGDEHGSHVPVNADAQEGMQPGACLGASTQNASAPARAGRSRQTALPAGTPPSALPSHTSSSPSLSPSAKTTSFFLLVKRPESGLLAGLWEFPAVVVAGPSPPVADDPFSDELGEKMPENAGADDGPQPRVGKAKGKGSSGSGRGKMAKAKGGAKGETDGSADDAAETAKMTGGSEGLGAGSIGGKGLDGLLWRWLGVKLLHPANFQDPATACRTAISKLNKDSKRNAGVA